MFHSDLLQLTGNNESYYVQHQPKQAQVPSPPRKIIQSPVVNENNDDIDDCQRWKQGSSSSPTPPKGLSNPSGTACYINASLLLLCYTCTPIITQYLTQVITNFCSNSTTERNGHLYDHQLPSHQRPLLQQATTDDQSLDEYECELILLLCNILRNKCKVDDGDKEEHRHLSSIVVDPTRFYQSLIRDEISSHPNPVHSSNLFQIRYTICGDAVSTLIQLIRFLQDTLSRRETKELDIGSDFISNKNDDAMMPQQELPLQKSSLTPQFNLVDRLIHSGQVYSVLTGTKATNSSNYRSSDSVIPGRIPIAVVSKVSSPGPTKISKVRPMMNPMPMTIHPQQQDPNVSCCHRYEAFPALHDVLYNTFCTEQHVMGYTWNDEVRAEDNSASSTVTTRRWHALSFPPIFMIHLQRFTIKGAACNDTPIVVKPKEDCNSHVRIPTELDMSVYLSAQPPNHENDATARDTDILARPSMVTTTASSSFLVTSTCGNNDDNHYHLVGGILHIHDYDENDTDEVSVGHYVSVVRQRTSPEDQWYVLDDEHVNPVSIDQVVLWLGGGWYDDVSKCRSDDNNHCGSTQLFARGVLLVYEQQNLKCGADWDVIPTTMFRDLSLLTSCQLGTSREQKSASWLQQDIAPASLEDTFPGTNARTNALITTKSYWLDDSDDDD